jgi:hypothetical protein
MFGNGNWQDIQYIVMSNGMKQAMQENGSAEDFMLYALDYHSTEVWHIKKGDVFLAIYQIQD